MALQTDSAHACDGVLERTWKPAAFCQASCVRRRQLETVRGAGRGPEVTCGEILGRPRSSDRGSGMDLTVSDVHVQICISFPRVDFSRSRPLWVHFRPFSKPVSSDSVPLTETGWPGSSVACSRGLSLRPGTAENSVARRGLFST